MKPFLIAFYLTVWCLMSSCSDSHTPATGHENFSVIRHVEELPHAALEAVRSAWPPGKPGIANPGEAFQETDQITGASLPYRQLVFAASSGSTLYVLYKRGGGRGLYWCFVKVDLAPAAHVSEAGILSQQPRDVAELLFLVGHGRFADAPIGGGVNEKL